MSWAKKGSATSEMIRPTAALVRPEASERASRFGRKPSSRAAASTRVLVPAATPYSPFRAREAVFRLTPARAATSASVGRLRELTRARQGRRSGHGCAGIRPLDRADARSHHLQLEGVEQLRHELRVDAARQRMGDRGAGGGD